MAEAYKMTAALNGRWYGHYGVAACPVCQRDGRRHQSALTLSDGYRGLLLNCKKRGCGFLEILAAARVLPKHGRQSVLAHITRPQKATTSDHAKKIWEESRPLNMTVADTYLRRVRKVDPLLTPALRFNPCTWHGPTRQNLPAMIAQLETASGFAVSRTYLRPDGTGKADLAGHEQRLMLGSAAGGHVPLRTGNNILFVAEGIETALSLPMLDMPASATLWATLSSANMRSLRLPENPGKLVIATDGDEAGHSAGDALACRAARTGWTVEMMPAPDGFDWNDVLVKQAGIEGGSEYGV